MKKGKLKSKTAAKQLSTKLLYRKCSFMQFLLNDMENFLLNVLSLCSALAFKFMQNFWRFFNHANLNVKIYQVVLFRFFLFLSQFFITWLYFPHNMRQFFLINIWWKKYWTLGVVRETLARCIFKCQRLSSMFTQRAMSSADKIRN